MALEIRPVGSSIPCRTISIEEGEEEIFTLDITDQLDGDTIKTKTMTITDSNGESVTADFGGGLSESSGVLTFGVKGYAVGTYIITFVVTCNEKLPDGVTPREFEAGMVLKIG